MKYLILYGEITFAILLFYCSDQSISANSDNTGSIQVLVNLDKVRKLGKEIMIDDREALTLSIVLSAKDSIKIEDTLALTNINMNRSIRITYGELPSIINNNPVEWLLSVHSLDKKDSIIHSGDTAFTIPTGDTAHLYLPLYARYSMLTTSLFPVVDGMRRYELLIDGKTVTDTIFSSNIVPGNMMTLSYDYLSANPEGIMHHLVPKIYGDVSGSDTLLYTGELDILVQTDRDTYYNIVLDYEGEDSTLNSLLEISIMIGNLTTRSHYLTMTNSGNGAVSESDSVIHGIPHTVIGTSDSGYNFSVWRLIEGIATIDDSTSNTTLIVLNDGDASIEGIFTHGITFIKSYGDKYDNKGLSVQEDNDGCYNITGTTEILDLSTDYYPWKVPTIMVTFTMEVNAEGEFISKQVSNRQYSQINSIQDTIPSEVYDSTAIGTNFLQTTDSGYIFIDTMCYQENNICQHRIYLIKTDEGGDTLWTRTFGEFSTDYYGSQIMQTKDQGYIIVGYIKRKRKEGTLDNDILLIKTDENGNVKY